MEAEGIGGGGDECRGGTRDVGRDWRPFDLCSNSYVHGAGDRQGRNKIRQLFLKLFRDVI